MNNLHGGVFFFGPFRMDAAQRSLWRDDQPIPLTPKEFDTLLVLLQSGGEMVRKETIVSRVWPDTFVSDSSLTRNVSVLRKALGDDVIQTVPKFGYRLTGPVTVLPAAVPAPAETAAEEIPATEDVQGSMLPHLPKRTWIALVVLVLLAGTDSYVGDRKTAATSARSRPAPGRIRIAVLPFANLTGDDGQEYFCDGLTEAMISELSRLSPGQLDVIARTSAMQYKHTIRSVPQIASELKVAYVLESSLRESDKTVRVTTQLVRGSDAGHLWTGEYERELKDVLTVQQQLAIAIAGEIKLKLTRTNGAPSRNQRPVDAEAYRDYLLGRFYWNRRNREGLLRSLDYFRFAVARDPGYAPAYAGLADAYLVLGGGYLPVRESYSQARAAALKALDLDPGLAEAWCSLAYEEFINERRWAEADANYQRAISLDPGYATAHHWYAQYLSAMSRHDEAIQEIKRALELDPLSVAINYNSGAIYTEAGRYGEAVAQLRRALEIDPGNAVTHGALAVAYERKKLYKQAVAEFETAQRQQGGYSPYAIEAVHVYAMAGETAKARAVLHHLLDSGNWAEVSPISFARAYASLGKKDEAFRWL
jgi:TolB-like protein/DNA-binding winged helix-turn-helix (wHTH) protein/Tfp pilus assembly protein PilF